MVTILIAGLIIEFILIIILGIKEIIQQKLIAEYKNEINDSDRAIEGWITNCEDYKKEIKVLKEEIKNLHLDNDSINEQINTDKRTYQLEHNQIEKIRDILKG